WLPRYVLRRDGVLQNIIRRSPAPAGVLVEERLSLFQIWRMEVSRAQGPTAPQGYLENIRGRATETWIVQAPTSRAVQQVGIGGAKQGVGSVKRFGVVQNPCQKSDGRGKPLRRYGVGRPELEVTPGPHLREERAQVLVPVFLRQLGNFEPLGTGAISAVHHWEEHDGCIERKPTIRLDGISPVICDSGSPGVHLAPNRCPGTLEPGGPSLVERRVRENSRDV